MNIALFGGTFDPIHRGHLAVARAAAEAFRLKQIHFVVTALSPHKLDQRITPFPHRYAMTALALAEEKSFIPSLLEAPTADPEHVNYAIDSIRSFKRTMKNADRLFYILGADAFEKISTWHEREALFREVEFIIASRPGYKMADVAGALPESLRPSDAVLRASAHQKAEGTIVLPGVTLHLLPHVNEPAASSDVRAAIGSGKSIKRFLVPAVAEYIHKTGIYKAAPQTSATHPRKPAKTTGNGASKRAASKPAKVLEFHPTGIRKKS